MGCFKLECCWLDWMSSSQFLLLFCLGQSVQLWTQWLWVHLHNKVHLLLSTFWSYQWVNLHSADYVMCIDIMFRAWNKLLHKINEQFDITVKVTLPIGYVTLDHESWQVCIASSCATEVAPRMIQVARLCPKVMLLDVTLLFFPMKLYAFTSVRCLMQDIKTVSRWRVLLTTLIYLYVLFCTRFLQCLKKSTSTNCCIS